MSKTHNRRRVLRGMLGGAAVTVGLPLLECFLDGNGTALASGVPIPVRFGTWFWGLGMNKQLFVPDKVGADYDLKEELVAIKPVQKYINVFTNYRTNTDGRPALCHYSGWVMLRCGEAPVGRSALPGESIDVTISDAIGGASRFRSLELAATGNKADSYSFRNAQSINPPEISAVDFYQRVFGAEFQDPNSPDFKPNPDLMMRKSVISGVLEQRAAFEATLGQADRARMDEYFTSIRSLEQRLALQLQKPPPALACSPPGKGPGDVPAGLDADVVEQRHKLMTDILVMALACNQTRVFNMVYSESGATTTKRGTPSAHHPVTHEEANNADGYQPTHSWFVRRAMDSWAYFVTALANVREGDKTLLDNTLVYAQSDQEQARTHTMNGIPMMTAGRAGGRIKSGLHVSGQNERIASEVGLTMMQAMGLDRSEWGGGSMKTSKVVSEVLV